MDERDVPLMRLEEMVLTKQERDAIWKQQTKGKQPRLLALSAAEAMMLRKIVAKQIKWLSSGYPVRLETSKQKRAMDESRALDAIHVRLTAIVKLLDERLLFQE